MEIDYHGNAKPPSKRAKAAEATRSITTASSSSTANSAPSSSSCSGQTGYTSVFAANRTLFESTQSLLFPEIEEKKEEGEGEGEGEEGKEEIDHDVTMMEIDYEYEIHEAEEENSESIETRAEVKYEIDYHGNNPSGDGDNFEGEDGVQVTNSTLLHPGIAYPHSRHLCGVHPYIDIDIDTRSTTPNSLLEAQAKNALVCGHCYCYVCDKLASDCADWEMSLNHQNNKERAHCHAKSDSGGYWDQLRLRTRNQNRARDVVELLGDSQPSTPLQTRTRTQLDAGESLGDYVLLPRMSIHDSLMNLLMTRTDRPRMEPRISDYSIQNDRPRRELRITEVLAENLKELALTSSRFNSSTNHNHQSSNKEATSRDKMEGDIGQLNHQNSFYVLGVKIGWPYPEILPPQRQMALHIIKALQRQKHVVIESPTGTGKSAAILCSVLAWQRYAFKLQPGSNHSDCHQDDFNTGNGKKKNKVIYCSRTHTQVAQMVASLQKTPYRPKMAILGSRDRLCIHRDLRPRGRHGDRSGNGNGNETVSSDNLHHECRVRVKNSERYRRTMLQSISSHYDDYHPPETLPGDGEGASSQTVVDADNAVFSNDINNDNDDNNGNNNDGYGKFKTCPHYRRLTTPEVAVRAHTEFVPNAARVDGCCTGGEETKLGTHDIEDLVRFGTDPLRVDGIAIYRHRDRQTDAFGFSLGQDRTGGNLTIHKIHEEGAAHVEGSLQVDDVLVNVNGKSVKGKNIREVTNLIKSTTKDPLLLDVYRGGGGCGDNDVNHGDDYSSRSACPYYLSQALAKNADLVFAPYNYVLDPNIRSALGIDLSGSVVVLDEAHNIESTLRDGGSGKFGEMELCELVVMLDGYSRMRRSHYNQISQTADGLTVAETEVESTTAAKQPVLYAPDVAHELLLFLEKIVLRLKESRDFFEKNPAKAVEDYKKNNPPDDKEYEIWYHGPTGYGFRGKPVGCKQFFDTINFTEKEAEMLLANLDALENYLRPNYEGDIINNLLDRLREIITKLHLALKSPEHYFISSVVSANGNLEFATGVDDEDLTSRRMRRFKKLPKKMPIIPPRTETNLHSLPNLCSHKKCRKRNEGEGFAAVRHGVYCDGSKPRWQAFLVLNLLSPGILMQDLSDQCQSIVLASGSLAPIQSLCSELNLLPPNPSTETKPSLPNLTTSDAPEQEETKKVYKLQTTPKPLEANHVINLSKQLLAVGVGLFPDGSQLCVKQSNYNRPGFLLKLGGAIATIIEGIPNGGVLVFLPSYSLLKKCVTAWDPDGRNNNGFSLFHTNNLDSGETVWERLIQSKGKVIVEPNGGQAQFEMARSEYNDEIRRNGNCVLLAVFRGKMSEGVSFNDDFARGVICVGIPYPNMFDRAIKAKKAYNDEQRKFRNRGSLLTGHEWYSQQAYRAIAQALGRCIRHAGDYGVVILLDSRLCDDGSPMDGDGLCYAHKNLPKWMRHCVKTLRIGGYSSSWGGNEILGGWQGLSQEMKRFFNEAKIYGLGVLQKQQEDMKIARKLDQQANGLHFEVRTGRWTSHDFINGGSINKSSVGGKGVTREINNFQNLQQPQSNFAGTPMLSSQNVKAQSLIEIPSSEEKELSSEHDLDPRIFEIASQLCERQEALSQGLNGNRDNQSNAITANAVSANSPHVSVTEANPQTNEVVDVFDVDDDESQAISPFPKALNVASSQKSAEKKCFSPGNNLCVICEENIKDVVLLPCQHLCLCHKCFQTNNLVTCPMCRQNISTHMKVYT